MVGKDRSGVRMEEKEGMPQWQAESGELCDWDSFFPTPSHYSLQISVPQLH